MICLCFTNAPFVLRIHLDISPSQRSQDRLSSGAPLDSSLLPDFPLLLLLQSAPFVICSLKYILWSLPSIIKLLLSCYQHYGRWAFLGHCPLKSNCVGKPGRLRSAHSAAGINSCPAEDWLCFWFFLFWAFLILGLCVLLARNCFFADTKLDRLLPSLTEMMSLSSAVTWYWIISSSCPLVGGWSQSSYSVEFSLIIWSRLTLWS